MKSFAIVSLVILNVILNSGCATNAGTVETRKISSFFSCKGDAVSDAIRLMRNQGKLGTASLNAYNESRMKAWVDFENLNNYCVVISYNDNCDVVDGTAYRTTCDNF